MTEYIVPNKRQKTIERYEGLILKHIAPDLGRIELTKLTPREIRTLEAKLTAQGMAPATLSTEALKSVAGRYLVQFGDGPLFLEHGFPLPLSGAIRHTAVKSAGAFVENVDIVIQLPDTWPVSRQSTTAVRKGGLGVVYAGLGYSG